MQGLCEITGKICRYRLCTYASRDSRVFSAWYELYMEVSCLSTKMHAYYHSSVQVMSEEAKLRKTA